MTEDVNQGRKGFWDFCCEHPIASVIIAIVLAAGMGDVASAVSGHYEYDHDGFWSSNCAEVKVP